MESENLSLKGIRTYYMSDTGPVLYWPNQELVMLWVRNMVAYDEDMQVNK